MHRFIHKTVFVTGATCESTLRLHGAFHAEGANIIITGRDEHALFSGRERLFNS